MPCNLRAHNLLYINSSGVKLDHDYYTRMQNLLHILQINKIEWHTISKMLNFVVY